MSREIDDDGRRSGWPQAHSKRTPSATTERATERATNIWVAAGNIEEDVGEGSIVVRALKLINAGEITVAPGEG